VFLSHEIGVLALQPEQSCENKYHNKGLLSERAISYSLPRSYAVAADHAALLLSRKKSQLIASRITELAQLHLCSILRSSL
jgi:hypothetical protein